MQRRKRSKWLQAVSTAQSPIRLSDFSSETDKMKLIAFIYDKIQQQELNGLLDYNNVYFIPKSYLNKKIQQFLDTGGMVDICELIDIMNIDGKLLEPVIYDYVQQIEGFFDIIKRRFFTPSGAIVFITKYIGKNPSHDLDYMLNHLYWTDDQLEAVLDLMAKRNLFRGYIDPIKQRLYNLTHLDFFLPSLNERSTKAIKRFITTSFLVSSEVSIMDFSRLTALSDSQARDLLDIIREDISFIRSKDGNYIYSTIDIVSRILWDIYVYEEIPLDFWVSRFDLAYDDLLKLLEILNESLGGSLTQDRLSKISLISWFGNGIDIEGIASKLNLNVLKLLKLIKNIATRLRLRLVAGDSINPFLIKGIENLEIFCQIDTSSYTNPDIYFECQNCRRVMCSNCRKIDSTHECPFCGNIAAFIIDLPRNCHSCQLTYAFSYNLETTEECYFCKQGPLKSGWTSPKEVSMTLNSTENQLINYIQNSQVTNIPLNQIIDFVGESSDVVIKILEKLITHQKIMGTISIRKMQLQIRKTYVSFECVVCNWVKTDQEKFICEFCNAEVCQSCYQEMESVGMSVCPECGSSLKLS